MKIKILTIHFIHNFGSVFQAFALNKYIKDNGYDVEMLDYRPKYLDGGRNAIKTYIGRVLNLFSFIKRNKKYNSFISEYMDLSSDRFTSVSQLKNEDDRDVLFIAGGDQLWNDYHYSGQDDAFKLTFVEQGEKSAFGTSLGRDNFTEEEANKLCSKVCDFNFIGVREKSSSTMLSECGVSNVYHVADPVLLLSRDFYYKNMVMPDIHDEYIVVYLVKKSPMLDKVIEYIRNNTKYKVVHVCGFVKKCDNDYFLKDTGPRELLGLIRNAKLVVSASFHATLFSIYFEKQFVSLLPHVNTNARITQLLEFFELSDRIYHTDSDMESILDKSIDYEPVSSKMDEFITASKDLLDKMLKENEKG